MYSKNGGWMRMVWKRDNNNKKVMSISKFQDYSSIGPFWEKPTDPQCIEFVLTSSFFKFFGT